MFCSYGIFLVCLRIAIVKTSLYTAEHHIYISNIDFSICILVFVILKSLYKCMQFKELLLDNIVRHLLFFKIHTKICI